MVFSQTIGVRILMKVQYVTKFELALIPLILVMIAFPLSIQYPPVNTAWIVSNILIVLIGFSIGLISSFLSALAGMLGPDYIGSLMQGFSCSFMFVSFLRLICLLSFPGQDDQSYFKGTILYFSMNIVILTAMAITIPCFLRSDIMIGTIRRDTKSVDDLMMTVTSSARMNGGSSNKKIWVEALVIFFVFGLTFMLYPSIIYQKSSSIFPTRPDWSIFILNVSESVGDFTGRSLARIKDSYSRQFLVAGTILRMIFIATTFMIAMSDGEFWNNQALIIVNVFLLGLTNGFFATAACRTIPGLLDGNEKEYGGFVMSVMINAGIGTGSLISLLGFSHLFSNN